MTAVLLFDGDCAFCSTSARWLRRWVKPACTILPYQHTDLSDWQVTAARAAQEVLWVERRDDVVLVWGGAPAIARVLRAGVAPWPVIGVVMDRPGIRLAASAVYRWVADHRHRLPGGTPACRLDPAA